MEESMVYLRNPTELSPSPGKLRPCALLELEVRKCRRKIESDSERENATVGDSEVEVQELGFVAQPFSTKVDNRFWNLEANLLGIDCDTTAFYSGEGWETTTPRAKRTRCIYSNVLEKPDHPESLELLGVDDGSFKPSSAEWDSSASNSEDQNTDQASKPPRKKSKLIRELKSHENQQTFNAKDQNKDVISRETAENLDLELVEKLHQSSFASHCVYMDNEDVMDIVLVDVQLSVRASPRPRNFMFVSVRSEASGIAVIGYPLDVGKMRDSPETLLVSEGGGRSRFDQLVWPTCRRTPVCYVSSSLPASIRAGAAKGKLQKSRKQGKAAVEKTCVPVELVFSKILAAVD